jgi:hypothetical protein
MVHLMAQTKEIAKEESDFFRFATFEQLQAGNVLVEPVWFQAGMKEPVALLD